MHSSGNMEYTSPRNSPSRMGRGLKTPTVPEYDPEYPTRIFTSPMPPPSSMHGLRSIIEAKKEALVQSSHLLEDQMSPARPIEGGGNDALVQSSQPSGGKILHRRQIESPLPENSSSPFLTKSSDRNGSPTLASSIFKPIFSMSLLSKKN